MVPSDLQEWWEDGRLHARLTSALEHISDARNERYDQTLRACRRYLDGINILYTALHYASMVLCGGLDDDDSDAKKLTALLLAIPRDRRYSKEGALHRLAAFEPPIMDQSVLTKSLNDPWIEPVAVPEDVREPAARQHNRFKRAFDRYYATATGYVVLIKRLASLIAVFRNNLQHGEKARRQRDYEIADVFRPVLDETVELVFNHPSARLATYGTLADDKTFARVTGIVPTRSIATVLGILREHGPYKVFCHEPQTPINVSLASFTAERLTFAKLDDYEGHSYRRVLTTATMGSRTIVCNIYTVNVATAFEQAPTRW